MINPFESLEERLDRIERMLTELLTRKEPPRNESDRWFNIKELCNYLPDKPAIPTVYGWVHVRAIPCHKGQKKLRFLKSEIDQWLKNGKKKTAEEIAKEAKQYIEKKRYS